MGGLIGDYIYAHIENYSRYGLPVSKKKRNETYDFMEQKNRIVKQWIAPITNNARLEEKKVQEIQKELKTLYESVDNKSLKPIYQQIVHEIESKLQPEEVANVALQKFNTITSSGNLTPTLINQEGERVLQDLKGFVAPTKIKTENIEYQTINKYYTALSAYIEGQLKGRSVVDKAALRQCRNKINSAYKQLRGAIEATPYHLVSTKEDLNVKTILAIGKLLSNTPTASYLGEIGEKGLLFALLKTYGAIEDDVLTTFQTIGKETTSLTLGNGMTITWAGKETYKRTLDYSKYDAHVKIDGIQREPDSPVVSLAIDNKGSTGTGKVDIRLTLPDNTNIGLSMKNVNLAGGRPVSLGTYSSLNEMIQYIDGMFVNHWLNVTAKHYARKDHNKLEPVDKGLYTRAHNSMKAILALIALTGFTKDVDYFVINNNTRTDKTGDIPVAFVPIETVIDKMNFLSNDSNILSRTMSVQIGSADSTKMTAIASHANGIWRNAEVDPEKHDMSKARARINILLNHVHQTKVKIGFLPTPVLRMMGNNVKGYYN